MNRIFVKLKTSPTEKAVIFELPGDLPVKEIVANLAQGENWPSEENGKPIEYWFESPPGRRLEDDQTLTQTEIKNMSLVIVNKSSDGSRVSIKYTNPINTIQTEKSSSRSARGSLGTPTSINWDNEMK